RAGSSSAGIAGTPNTAGNAGAPPNHGGNANAGAAGTPYNADDGYADLLEYGKASTSTTRRPAYGSLAVANAGERSYVVESRRDVETGPLGLPWRSRFRLAAYDSGALVWTYPVDPDDLVGGVVVHPSEAITLSVERYTLDKGAYQLVRLDREGHQLGVTTLQNPTTIPASDYASTDPQPLFRMKSALADATTAGWVAMLPDGEGLALAILSYVDARPSDSWSNRMALGVETLDWTNNGYVERWGRIVEGSHVAEPAAWAYDELRWREQAVRPFLARDSDTQELVVGRVWNSSRCDAHRAVFGQFSKADCVLTAVGVLENERLPLAVTRFSAGGVRSTTVILAPEDDAAEQVPFALAASDGQYLVGGSVVRTVTDGSKRTYPDPAGFVDYDGFVSAYAADGKVLARRDFNLGHGDVLASLHTTTSGLVAVGSSGWDRWQGGMSISRGADPLFVWVSRDMTRASVRSFSMSDGTRHFTLHDVAVTANAIIGYGFADAPMTHSGDGDNASARTFGGLQIRLSSP
ncbi:MAG TPA: hypothetical protein VIV60_36430, partial [Polyangiaceae bacterium]